MKQKRIVSALLAAGMVMPLAAAAEWTVYGRAPGSDSVWQIHHNLTEFS